MNIAGNERLLDKLAAEYVLGTLKGGARRRFERWLQTDSMVRRATAEWQDRLHPMAQLTPAVAPPAHLWHAITRELGLSLARQEKRSFWRSLRDDLAFWRGLGMTTTALATILVAVLATRPAAIAPVTTVASAPFATYVAMLADDKAQPVALVTGDERTGQLTARLIQAQPLAADQSLQLWAVPKTGKPRSLGLLDADRKVNLILPADTTPQSVSLLAISREQKGGSPNPDGPTGPIVFKGAWLTL